MEKTSSEIDKEIDIISEKILSEIETASNKNISDTRYAKKILQLSDLNHTSRIFQELERASPESVCLIEKKAVIQALLLSTWLQRLYFIIRSALMAILGGFILFFFILYMGKIDAVVGIFLNILLFVLMLVITRLFDSSITNATKKIVRSLGKHRKIRDFIMNHF
jgi:hypothetical protein